MSSQLLSINENLEHEIVHSEHLRVGALAWGVLVTGLCVIGIFLLPTLLWAEPIHDRVFLVVGAMAVFLTYAQGMRRWLKGVIDRGESLPAWWHPVVVVAEQTQCFLLVIAVSLVEDRLFALIGPATFLPMFFILFTALGLDMRVAIFGGVVAMAQYLVLVVWWLPDVQAALPDSHLTEIPGLVVRGIFLLVFGLIIGLVAREIRRRMEAAFQKRDSDLSMLTAQLAESNLNLERKVEQRTADLVEATEEAEAARDRAMEANRAKSQFLANMSHEIRTPMNAVVGLTDLCLRADVSHDVRDYLGKLRTSSRSLMGIINDILDFSRVEAGKLTVETEDFDLQELTAGLSDLVSDGAVRKGLEFLVLIESEVPCALRGDSLRIGQVLTNLAGNAVKFTETGEVVVRVRLVESDSDRAKIEFQVTDSGIGIAPKVLSKLFEPFTQADGSHTRRHGGAGLGLTISKRLVELMGGELLVESEPGKGSTFSFALELERQPEGNEVRLLPPSDVQGTRVLVVDDHSLTRKTLLEMLTSFRLNAEAAGSGREALEMLAAAVEEEPFSVVIMDWKMPGMDGIEASMRIRQDPRLASRPPKVILVIAYGREDVMQGADEAGLDGFLLKPVSQSMLYNCIVEVTGVVEPTSTSTGVATPIADEDSMILEGARVLVVEDNVVNQEIVREMLRSGGAAVEIADDGREAVRKVADSKFDVVLMDVQMPEMDGYEATAAIRKDARFKELPIIALTAHAMAGDREKCLAAGMDGYLTKPIEREELLSTVASVLGGTSDSSAEAPQAPACGAFREGDNSEDLPGIDVRAALARLGGNRQVFDVVLAEFAKEYARAAIDIRDAWERGESEQARLLTHGLKGVSGNISAVELYKAALALEAVIKGGDSADFVARLDTLELALNEVVESCGGRPK